jgi:predicted DNA-binding transcriptional regulator YafY
MAGNTARLYRIEALIRSRGHASFRTLQEALEVSPATLKRDLEYLRSRLGAPIEYDRDLNAYRFGKGYTGPRHELPGLWFDESELYSLLTAQQLLTGLDSDGLLSRHLQPLLDRIQHCWASGGGHEAAERITQRVKIVTALRRAVPGRFFERISSALLTRRRLHLRYLTRGRGGEVSERDVSPQRLVHYRNTWYLDAWCHRANALRRFALDAVQQAQVLETAAQDCRWRRCRRRWTRATASTPAANSAGRRWSSTRRLPSGPAAKSGTLSSVAVGWKTAATSCACPTWTTPSW